MKAQESSLVIAVKETVDTDALYVMELEAFSHVFFVMVKEEKTEGSVFYAMGRGNPVAFDVLALDMKNVRHVMELDVMSVMDAMVMVK